MLKRVLLIFAVIGCLGANDRVEAIPDGDFVNPLTETAWGEILPFRIGGVTLMPGSGYDTPDPATAPVCACPAPPPLFWRIGIPISWWNPDRQIELVKDPLYFPSFGLDVGGSFLGGGELNGSSTTEEQTATKKVSFQGHWIVYPLWAILNLLKDSMCVSLGGIDLFYITEIDPLWNDESLSMLIHPEVLLFANPIAQMACVADAVAVNTWRPLEVLFWCMGSSGSAYPLTGELAGNDLIQGAMGGAGRMIYKLSRQFLLWDTGINWCQPTPTPIWVKPNYKLQPQRPMVRMKAFPIGKSSWMYQTMMNPATGTGVGSADNFTWLLFRKNVCCFL